MVFSASSEIVTTAGFPSATDGEELIENREDFPLLLPPTNGDELAVFSGGVSSIGANQSFSGGSVQLYQDGSSICTGVTFPGMQGASCYALKDIQTGVAYGAWQTPDGVIRIVGVVPDDAASVSIAGSVVEVSQNLWMFEGKSGQNLAFSVSSADGAISAGVG